MLCVRIKSSQMTKHMVKTFSFMEYNMFQFNSAVGLDNMFAIRITEFPETFFYSFLSTVLD